MPRHAYRRRRRSRRPVALAAALLAVAASLLLAALAPSISSGVLVPIAVRAPGPAAPATPSLHVGGVPTDLGIDDQRTRRAISRLPLPVADLVGYQWPLPNGRITLPFGPWRDGSRIVDGQPFHDGVDLATFCGDRIVAAHDGVVVAAGRHYDSQMGWIGDLAAYFARLDAKSLWSTLPIVVVVDDGNGYRSMYAHFEKLVVDRGQAVRAGQLLGYEGRTGNASGCHLHYGLFSPRETARFGIALAVAEHMKLPSWEIARVDPLGVLPARASPPAVPVVPPDHRAIAGDDGSY